MTQPEPGGPGWGAPPRHDAGGLVEVMREIRDLKAQIGSANAVVPLVHLPVNLSNQGITFTRDGAWHIGATVSLLVPPAMTRVDFQFSAVASGFNGYTAGAGNQAQIQAQARLSGAVSAAGPIISEQIAGSGSTAGAVQQSPAAPFGGSFTGLVPGATLNFECWYTSSNGGIGTGNDTASVTGYAIFARA